MATEPKEAPDWECCEQDGCIGVRLEGDIACLAHATPEQREKALARLGQSGELDARGVPISVDLLTEILAAAPQVGRRAHLGSARFERATFADWVDFGGRRGRYGALDIPRPERSSGLLGAVAPGGVFVVGGVVAEAAVEDADEAVGEGSEGGYLLVAAGSSPRRPAAR